MTHWFVFESACYCVLQCFIMARVRFQTLWTWKFSWIVVLQPNWTMREHSDDKNGSHRIWNQHVGGLNEDSATGRRGDYKWVWLVWCCVQHGSQFVSIGNIAAPVGTKIAPWVILAWLTSFWTHNRFPAARNTTENQFLSLWVDSTFRDVCIVFTAPY